MSNSEQTTKAKQTAEKPKLTPEQREAQRKQALDDAAKKAVSSVTNLRAYLAVQSRFERYSTNNNLLIFAQRPDATRLKSLELWNKEKKWIREGAKAVAIYEPVRKQGKDGKNYTNFVRKNMFDISDIWVIIVTAVMMIVNEFVAGMDTGNDAVNIILGYFWGTTVFDGNMTTSRFPMFSWIVFPVAGYLIGKRLMRATDKDTFYKTVGKLFLLLSVPFTVAGLFTGMFDTGFTGIGFYHQGILINIWCTLLSFDWIVVMYLVSKKVPSRYMAHLERWSRNITSIYVLHFVVLAVAIQIMPRSFGIIGCIIVFLVLFFVVDAAASYLNKTKKRSVSYVA